jgi:hypothetical protein
MCTEPARRRLHPTTTHIKPCQHAWPDVSSTLEGLENASVEGRQGAWGNRDSSRRPIYNAKLSVRADLIDHLVARAAQKLARDFVLPE